MITDYRLPLIVIGSGGHGKVLIEALKEYQCEIVGIVDPQEVLGSKVLGVEVIGDDLAVFNFNPVDVELICGIGTVPGNTIRTRILGNFLKHGYSFATVIDKGAIVKSSCLLEKGVQIMSRAVIQTNAVIQRNVIINTGSIVEHDSVVGENSHIATGSMICGGVTIGKNTHICAGSVISHGVAIGDNCVIGAGSVVYRDVADNTKYIQKRDLCISKA